MTDEKGAHSHLTEIEIEIIVEKAVRKSLTNLGIDLSDTKALQSVQADFVFMRQQRQGAENLKEWVKRSAVTVLIAAALAVMWQGLLSVLPHKAGVP